MRFSKRICCILCALVAFACMLSFCACSGVHPYAWLGLSNMPKCNYLDILAGNKYIRTFDYYVSDNCVEKTEAVDGVNSFSDDTTGKLYYIDGIILSVDDSAKIFIKQDLSAVAAQAKTEMEKAIQEGKNVYGRVFKTTGKEAIPFYWKNGDTTEYKYYEYMTDASTGGVNSTLTERFYMKDGDVFAIYKHAESDGQQVNIVEVIKTMSAEIPEGLLKMPDLTGYKEFKPEQ